MSANIVRTDAYQVVSFNLLSSSALVKSIVSEVAKIVRNNTTYDAKRFPKYNYAAIEKDIDVLLHSKDMIDKLKGDPIVCKGDSNAVEYIRLRQSLTYDTVRCDNPSWFNKTEWEPKYYTSTSVIDTDSDDDEDGDEFSPYNGAGDTYKTNDVAVVQDNLDDVDVEGLNANAKSMICCYLEVAHISRGISYNGIIYKRLASAPGQLKQGKQTYVSVRLHDYLAPQLCELARLGVMAKGYNIGKHEQYLMNGTSGSAPLDFTAGLFMDNIKIIDIGVVENNKGHFKFLNAEIEFHNIIKLEKDKSMSAKFLPIYKYWQNNSDGYALINAKYLPAEYRGCKIQLRGFGIKAEAYVVDFDELADDLEKHYGITNHNIPDALGGTFDFRTASMIIDKNTFKYYSLFMADKQENYKTYGDFAGFFKANCLYAINICMPGRPAKRLVNFGFQGYQFLCLGEDDMAEITKEGIAAVNKYDEIANDEEKYMEYLRNVVFAGQSYGDLIRREVADGIFAYTPKAVDAFESGRAAAYRRAITKCPIEGQVLTYMPDIIRYVAALHGVDVPGICGDDDAICCPYFAGEDEVLIERFPVCGFDLYLGKNIDCRGQWYEKYLREDCVYVGWHSTCLKRTAGDFDGDKGNATVNKQLISCYKKTLELFKYPLIFFFELDGKDITDSAMKTFDGSTKQIAHFIDTCRKNNKIGKTASVLSQVAGRIGDLMNEYGCATADDERDAIAKKIFDIYCGDIAPLVQSYNLYTDSFKRGVAIDWNMSTSYLGKDFYKNEIGKMPMSSYKTVITGDIYKCDRKVGDDGYSVGCEDHGNFRDVETYVRTRVKARLTGVPKHYGVDTHGNDVWGVEYIGNFKDKVANVSNEDKVKLFTRPDDSRISLIIPAAVNDVLNSVGISFEEGKSIRLMDIMRKLAALYNNDDYTLIVKDNVLHKIYYWLCKELGNTAAYNAIAGIFFGDIEKYKHLNMFTTMTQRSLTKYVVDGVEYIDYISDAAEVAIANTIANKKKAEAETQL